ncbi:XdhC family protein [Herbaspirillum sp. ST 5-3]|uniref:XdhC family protein n=1 Tax=Herbaspirillum sp. ST 5-3 TaxID=2567936 RepID=UPI0010A3DB38|nr:XdhC family protein [Herbaspirillum sp. ST 5-3]
MDSIDLEVLKACADWLAAGLRCQLVTVVKTWGSSPRPEGAMMAMAADGRVVGSVSGGCIEDDLIERVRMHGIPADLPHIVTYGVSADEAHRFGLPCGGTIRLALEPLSDASRIPELLQRVAQQELVARHLDLLRGQVQLLPARAGQCLLLGETELVTVHGPRWCLLVIGAGQLSRFLAQIATGMDYQVVVCDPREEYRTAWNLPEVPVVHAMPDDLVMEMRLDSRSAVVALTHDPKLDDLALMEALRSDAFYVGAIGSRANSEKRRERLKQFDLTDAQIGKLHGPIGLHLGSKTPPEIAISILAEMTAIRNGIQLVPEQQAGHGKTAAQQPASAASCGLRTA